MTCFIPMRLLIAILGIYSCALVYTQRSAMSVAIVAMTTVKGGPTPSPQPNHTRAAICDNNNNNNNYNNNENSTVTTEISTAIRLHMENDTESVSLPPAPPPLKPEFDWNEELQGIILGSQFYLYIIVPTIAGRITDRFGAKWVNFAGAIVPCLLSLLTPIGVRRGGVGVLIAIRTIDGAFHGCVYASLFSLYTKWLPAGRERTMANGSLFFGGSLGSTVMYALSGWACDTEIGWPLVYYLNASLYLPWIILWIYYCSNDPSDNRHISDEELRYIRARIPAVQQRTADGPARKRRVTPWIHIFTSIPVLASLFVKMCSGFGYFLLITKMPSYLSTVFGIAIFKNGLFSASTSLAQGLCALGAAPLSNWIIERFGLPVLHVRKVFQAIAMYGPAISLALIPSVGCNSTAAVALLLIGMFAYGCFTGGEWSTGSEYAPNSAGVVFGFSNSFAFLMGVIAPHLVGIMLDAPNVDIRTQWNRIMYITAGIYAIGPLPFFAFGTIKQQWWDRMVEEEIDDHNDHVGDAAKSTTGNSTDLQLNISK